MAKASADCAPEPMKAEDYLFMLYTSGSTGQAQGRRSFHRRLSAARRAHAQIRLRHPRRRRLFLHGGHRLGHRPQLRRLWPALQRRDDAHVRGRAHVSRRRPLLADRREIQGHRVLHRADRHPLAHPARRRMAGQIRPAVRCACSARSANRSIPKRGCGITASSAKAVAPSWTPGGRPRPAASSSPRCPARTR